MHFNSILALGHIPEVTLRDYLGTDKAEGALPVLRLTVCITRVTLRTGNDRK